MWDRSLSAPAWQAAEKLSSKGLFQKVSSKGVILSVAKDLLFARAEK
jgi:hypothetical protein